MEEGDLVPFGAHVRPVVCIIIPAKIAVVTGMLFSAARRFAPHVFRLTIASHRLKVAKYYLGHLTTKISESKLHRCLWGQREDLHFCTSRFQDQVADKSKFAQYPAKISPAYNPNSNNNIKQSALFFFLCKFNPVQIEFSGSVPVPRPGLKSDVWIPYHIEKPF